jgi:CheY-like chemotaxis protein
MPKLFHIVVADDDDDDQFIIKEAIKELCPGHINVTSVYDGMQLLDCLNKKGLFNEFEGNPDLIILDINMPLMNGLEALETIKNSGTFKNIPVVMLSTLRTIERVDKSVALGALNFYTKPNNITEYKTILQEVLDNTLLEQKMSA